MIIPMFAERWDRFEKKIMHINKKYRDIIAINVQFYERFIQFPDDTPQNIIDIINYCVGVEGYKPFSEIQTLKGNGMTLKMTQELALEISDKEKRKNPSKMPQYERGD